MLQLFNINLFAIEVFVSQYVISKSDRKGLYYALNCLTLNNYLKNLQRESNY